MKNPKTSRQAFVKNTQRDVFRFFLTSNFFLITFEKNTQGINLSTMYILACEPPSKTNIDQKMRIDHLFFMAKLVV